MVLRVHIGIYIKFSSMCLWRRILSLANTLIDTNSVNRSSWQTVVVRARATSHAYNRTIKVGFNTHILETSIRLFLLTTQVLKKLQIKGYGPLESVFFS